MTSSSSSFVVTTTCSRVTNGSKCTSGDSGSSSPPTASSSSVASSFFGAKDDSDPNPPSVVGAAHALELLAPLNPPNLNVVVGVLSFDCSDLEGVEEVREPKILPAVSVVAVVALLIACCIPSVVVDGATSVGPAVALGVAVSLVCGAVVAVVVSSTTGPSLFTPDMMNEKTREAVNGM